MTAATKAAGHRYWGWLTAVAVGISAVAIAGCGSASDSVSTSAGVGSQSPSIIEAEKLFDEIATGMRGTSAQSDSSSYLMSVEFQKALIQCMKGKGFVYLGARTFRVPSPTARFGGGVFDPVDSASLEADGLGMNATVDGLVANAKAGDPIVRDTSGMDGPPPAEYQVPGWDAAQAECMPAESDLRARVNRPDVEERSLPFTRPVQQVIDGKPVSEAMAKYPACMKARGWPVSDRNELVQGIRSTFEDLLVKSTPSFSTNPTRRAEQVNELVKSAAWQDLLQARSEAAAADATCRREAHDLALTALLPTLRSFKTEHQSEISELRTQWTAVEARASATPDPVKR